MSSVVISGDTSGSVTLSAPATAGSTVLTLPATSGTVITGPGGVTSVASGGTGASTLTANNVILGNGTSAVQFVAPGSSGNVLTSNGTTWASTAAASGQLQTQIFTAPGTWTKPATVTQVRVTVVGGGGGGGDAVVPTTGKGGGGGGYAKASNIPVTGPVAITVGAAGNGGATGVTGGTSSFGSAVSCTGGTGGSAPTPGTPGAATVSSGTNLRNYYAANILGITQIESIIGENLPSSGGPSTGVAFSASGIYGAGMGGFGGPVASTNGKGANGGVVIIEYVG